MQNNALIQVEDLRWMNIIKLCLLVCAGFIASQAQGMLINPWQKKSNKQYPTFEELEKRYTSHEGIVWDPEMIYSAQETGYIPTEVLIYDKHGNVKKRTIYHGTHVIAVQLNPSSDNSFSIFDKGFSKNASRVLYERSIPHPVILAACSHDGAEGEIISRGNYTIALGKSIEFLFNLGHELGHCKLFYEILYNHQFNNNGEIKRALMYRLRNSAREAMPGEWLVKNWDNEKHLTEFYCDRIAADILGDTNDRKKHILEAGINYFKKNRNRHGDECSDSHPMNSERIRYLAQQLQRLEPQQQDNAE